LGIIAKNVIVALKFLRFPCCGGSSLASAKIEVVERLQINLSPKALQM